MGGEFGVLLRQRRLQAGLTQEDLAGRAQVGVRTLRGLETGERVGPRLDTVRRIVEALELPVDGRVELLAAAGHVETAAPPPRVSLAAPVREALAQLAHAVRDRWQREEEHQQVQDPFPMPVRWAGAAAELQDCWANVRRALPGEGDGAIRLGGRLEQVVEVYRRIPSGRLVVLGRAGAGKSVLTLRFVLDLLRGRSAEDAVPVIFRLGTWNPATTGFREWLVGELVREHPGLTVPGPGGGSLASVLVADGLILPVLDGFDEVADGLHASALAALNASTLPLLMTSRTEQYAAAVHATDVLTSAAAVELTDLGVDDLAHYLPRTTRKSLWQPVLDVLRAEPDSDLAAVLTTPLMVVLARAIYSDGPRRDPAELLDSARFPTRDSIAGHLLGNFIPTVYAEQRGGGHQRWRVERVQHWFGELARHLDRLGTRDLAWWQLGASAPVRARVALVAVLTGFVLAVVDGLAEGLLFGFGTALRGGVMVGGLGVLTFGVAHGLLVTIRGAAPEPSWVRLRLPGGHSQLRRKLLPRTGIGLAGGLVFGLSYGFVRELVLRPPAGGLGEVVLLGLLNGAVFALVFGPCAALVFGLVGLLEAPFELSAAVSPVDLLKSNRRTVLFQLMVLGPVFAGLIAATGWLLVTLLNLLLGMDFFFWTAEASLLFGIVGGVGVGIGYALGLTAWGNWLVFARFWLPLTGRLPWQLSEFLEDAYRRGVLRQAGAVWQFRHARLQDHLARHR